MEITDAEINELPYVRFTIKKYLRKGREVIVVYFTNGNIAFLRKLPMGWEIAIDTDYGIVTTAIETRAVLAYLEDISMYCS